MKLNIKNPFVIFILFYLINLALPYLFLFFIDSNLLNSISYLADTLDIAILLIVFIFIYYFNKKTELIREFKLKAVHRKLYPYIILVLISAVFFRISVDPIIWIDKSFNFEAPVYDDYSSTNTDYIKNILTFFSVVILTPIVEEITFRGLIIKSLNKFNTNYKILISSALFSAMHLPIDINSLAIVFLLGIVLGIIALKLGLVFAIIFHFSYNLIWYLLDLYYTDYWHLISVLNFDYFYWCIILIALLLFILILKKIWINKNNY